MYSKLTQHVSVHMLMTDMQRLYRLDTQGTSPTLATHAPSFSRTFGRGRRRSIKCAQDKISTPTTHYSPDQHSTDMVQAHVGDKGCDLLALNNFGGFVHMPAARHVGASLSATHRSIGLVPWDC